jgi:hypothetical protein
VSYATLYVDLGFGLFFVVATLVISPIVAVRVSRVDIGANLQRLKSWGK